MVLLFSLLCIYIYYNHSLLIDLEWKVIYVGNAEDTSNDQLLDEVSVGPVPVGINKFVLQANAPDHALINDSDILGVTVVIVTCSYLGQEFIRIGYYVNNEYDEPYDPENPPNPVDIKKVFRNTLADEPRVTRYAIDWTGNTPALPPTDNDGTEIVVEEDNGEDALANLDDQEDEDDEDDEDDDAMKEVDLDDADDMEEDDYDGDDGDDDGEDFDGQVIMEEDSMDVHAMQQPLINGASNF